MSSAEDLELEGLTTAEENVERLEAQTDASSVALDAVLSPQEDPSQPLQPYDFYSWQFTPPERNYTIWERELLAIKTAFEVWRHYLEGPITLSKF